MRDLEQRVEELLRDKDQAVASEQYERASQLRDQITEVRRQDRSSSGGDQSAVPEVTVEDIAEVVSRATGVPVSQLTEEEKDRLLRLEQHLHERVVGQDEAVSAVAEAVRRVPGRPGRPGPAGRQLPVPRPDRGRQDRAGPRADRGAVRRGRAG